LTLTLTPNPPLPAPSPLTTFVYLPLLFKQINQNILPPDLVISYLEASPNGVTVILQNQGQGPVVDAFWVDVYLNPHQPPTRVNQTWYDIGQAGLVWGVTTLPLQPGQALTLTIGDGAYWPSLSHFGPPLSPGSQVYGQVDSLNPHTTYGGVLENHEISGGIYNNISATLSTANLRLNYAAKRDFLSSPALDLLPPRKGN
jgi:hypothetical protein